MSWQDQAEIVIIGGGVAGTSIAYHLAKLGKRDIVLLERADLTLGTTFHSAGLVGQLRASETLTKMLMYSVSCYQSLKEETGVDPDWRQVGSLRLATQPDRLLELKRQAGLAKSIGLPFELLSPSEAKELFPLMQVEDVLAAAYIPTDGYIDPTNLTHAFARGAEQRGVTIHTKTRVVGIETEGGRVHRVLTDHGPIRCAIVVNAAGMYAPEIGRMVGVALPIVPMSHQYCITEAIPGVQAGRADLPTMRDPDHLVYFRSRGDGLVMGGYERTPKPFGLEGIPADFHGRLLPPDVDRFATILEGATHRVPALAESGIREWINGPEAFTPDGEFILGETEIAGFFVAAGFCAHGIAGAGGVGRLMAEWIVEGRPDLDVFAMDVRRFGPHHRSRRYVLERTLEVYRTYYDVRFPLEDRQSERPLRTSPVYLRHKELQAVFGEKAGWERVQWYERNAPLGDPAERPEGLVGRIWSPAIGAEHRATRGKAACFDESSFSKLLVSGPGAEAFLQRMAAGDVARPVGSVIYTQLLNEQGGIEADLTITRLAPDRFRLVTGTAFGPHDLAWLLRHLPGDGSVRVEDITSSLACIALWGPKSRQILQRLTEDPLDSAAFPYMTARSLTIGSVPVEAQRVTYVGELGYELYCPSEYALRLWDTLLEAGQPEGLLPAGYQAIESLRLEKGYRAWSSDLTPETTPLEAGLGFAVKLEKPVDFLGKRALLAQRERGLERRLAALVLAEPRLWAIGGEPVLVDERVVGRVTSGGYGYTLRKSIAYAYLPISLAEPGSEVEVEVLGQAVPAVVTKEPLVPRPAELTR